MKKTVCIIILIMILCTAIFAGCSNANNDKDTEGNDNNSKTPEIVVPERPEDTTLEYWLTDVFPTEDMENHDEIPGIFGARLFLGKDYKALNADDGNKLLPEIYVYYLAGSWPDEINYGRYITKIEITDPEISVYGITIESTYEDFDKVFSDMGYEIKKDKIYHEAVLGRFSFCLKKTSVPKLILKAEVTNESGIVY